MARVRQRRVFLVSNAGDEAGTGAYLAALGGPDQHRAVVRPTPGDHDAAVLGADALVALGKNPKILRTEQLGKEVWSLARAWTIGLDVRDLVVDRVHLLTPEQIVALIQMAAGQATLWLIHGGTIADATAEYLDFLGHPVEQMPWAMLPTALRPAPAPQPTTSPPWPVLPKADFTTFLAACHRHLPRADSTGSPRRTSWPGSGPTNGPAHIGAADQPS
jgi:hypothetical protein